jgi:hypothetical protein
MGQPFRKSRVCGKAKQRCMYTIWKELAKGCPIRPTALQIVENGQLKVGQPRF